MDFCIQVTQRWTIHIQSLQAVVDGIFNDYLFKFLRDHIKGILTFAFLVEIKVEIKYSKNINVLFHQNC